jgi:hypothetical protein
MKLKLEGKIVGPWVSEFDRTWRSLAPSLGSRKLVVDLRGVMHMDSEARLLLTEIHQKTGADFLADTPMTQYFADEARHPAKKEPTED